MNTYTTEFFSHCPTNGVRIKYTLQIKSHEVIQVEAIMSAIAELPHEGYHEAIADELSKLGGQQTLTADHHGVTIYTERQC